mmetsp:Transcript_9792/g.29822  ORF Transcript_9792/g.29822 Transcript_9792/m.29822 type:complete len:384 (+) Transcript_9792:130-1281(+)
MASPLGTLCFLGCVCAAALLFAANVKGPCGDVRKAWRQVDLRLEHLQAVGRLKSNSSTDGAQPLHRAPGDEDFKGLQTAAAHLRRTTDVLLRAARAKGYPESCISAASNKYEFATVSRCGLDGLLSAVFAAVGTNTRQAIELDTASGTGSYLAAASLANFHRWDVAVFQHAWSAYSCAQLLLQGESASRLRLSEFLQPLPQGEAGERTAPFAQAPEVRVTEANLEGENIDALLRRHQVGGDVDLLCLFTFGDNYRIWRGLTQISPRVIVVEYQQFWGPKESVYRASCGGSSGVADSRNPLRRRLFVGASLGAFLSIARVRNYKLVACLRSEPIAVFILRDQSSKVLRELSAEDCIAAKQRDAKWRLDMAAQFEEAQNFKWTPT